MRFQRIKGPDALSQSFIIGKGTFIAGMNPRVDAEAQRDIASYLQGAGGCRGGSSARLSRADGKRDEEDFPGWIRGFGEICWPRGSSHCHNPAWR